MTEILLMNPKSFVSSRLRGEKRLKHVQKLSEIYKIAHKFTFPHDIYGQSSQFFMVSAKKQSQSTSYCVMRIAKTNLQNKPNLPLPAGHPQTWHGLPARDNTAKMAVPHEAATQIWLKKQSQCRPSAGNSNS